MGSIWSLGMGSSGSMKALVAMQIWAMIQRYRKTRDSTRKISIQNGMHLNLLCIPILACFGSISLGFGIDRMPAGNDFASVLKGKVSNDICVEKLGTNMNMSMIGSLIIEHPMFNDSIVSQPIPLRSRLRILCSGQIINSFNSLTASTG